MCNKKNELRMGEEDQVGEKEQNNLGLGCVRVECLKLLETEASHRGLDLCAGGEDTACVREGCMHCSSPIWCLFAGLAEIKLLLAWERH